MIDPFFLDTSFVVALEADGDQYHERAIHYWRTVIAPARPRLVTTDAILMEAVAFFQGRSRHDRAVRVGDLLRRGDPVTMVHVDETLVEQGWRRMVLQPDKSYSLVDCISFAVMDAMKIRAALTFDHHFAQAGFQTLPDLAAR